MEIFICNQFPSFLGVGNHLPGSRFFFQIGISTPISQCVLYKPTMGHTLQIFSHTRTTTGAVGSSNQSTSEVLYASEVWDNLFPLEGNPTPVPEAIGAKEPIMYTKLKEKGGPLNLPWILDKKNMKEILKHAL